MDEVEEGELTEEAIEGIKRGLKEISGGRTDSIEKAAGELQIKLS